MTAKENKAGRDSRVPDIGLDADPWEAKSNDGRYIEPNSFVAPSKW
jgi:hypothetical protein